MQNPRTAAAALGALALVAGTAGVVSSTAASAAPTSGESRSVLVLASSSASDAQVRKAISAAGGISPYANAHKAYILRGEPGKQKKIPFDYKKALKGQPGQSITLQTGDTVVVP